MMLKEQAKGFDSLSLCWDRSQDGNILQETVIHIFKWKGKRRSSMNDDSQSCGPSAVCLCVCVCVIE